METSIDIIWLNDKKKVVHVENNVEPDFEPHQVYKSPLPGQFDQRSDSASECIQLISQGARPDGIDGVMLDGGDVLVRQRARLRSMRSTR